MNYDNVSDKLLDILKVVMNSEEITLDTEMDSLISTTEEILDICINIDSIFFINCNYKVIEDSFTVKEILEHILILLD
ncbi:MULTISPECIES: hypothetical protein [Bacteria]|uniref:hypothetical protein n=1 Tax=Bacteria TaxID=2 RepID=UPI002E7ADC67|nr:hypothetical protein [Cetobacterium somerae]WVJ03071.1 hypothetical protein VSU16_15175 [Cetobacterium somerae]